MNRPVLAYGHSILKQRCKDIDKSFPHLDQFITDIWDTMYNANGCGLAAPQVGQAINLFIVDSKTTYDNLAEGDREAYFDKGDLGIKETFINAKIIERSPELWEDEEGCLSIPYLTQKIKRHWTITVEYCNRNFEFQTRTFSGITARMIQHEHDHTVGVLYLDYLNPLTKKLIESKLKKIVKGKIQTRYPMKFV